MNAKSGRGGGITTINGFPSLNLTEFSSLGSPLPRRHLDHVMWGGFFLAGGGDADVAGFLAEVGERFRAEVAHAGLDAANKGAEHIVNRA